MLSLLHEALIEMVRQRPALAAELLSGPLGSAVPVFEDATLAAAELTDVRPTEYRADAVVTLGPEGGAPGFAVVLEVQLRVDERKRFSWPVYVVTLYARLRCPVRLLVVCSDAAVAAWCAERIVIDDPGESGLPFVLKPLVLGPEEVPMITDPVVAQTRPEEAVLSGLAHGGRSGPDQQRVLSAVAAALTMIDDDHRDLYTDVLLTQLPSAARTALEAFMNMATYEFQSDFYRNRISRDVAEATEKFRDQVREECLNQGLEQGREEGREQGRVAGEAASIFTVLSARGIEVSDEVHARITGCTDLTLLETWVRRAATAQTAADLFEPDAVDEASR